MAKIFKILIVLLIASLALTLIFKFGTKALIPVKFDIYPRGPNARTPFSNYKADTVPADGKNYYIKFTNVAGSAAPGDSSRASYYNMDITVETTSRVLADSIQSNPDGAVSVIRGTLGSFRKEDAMNENGRKYLKERIRQDLAQRYGEDAIGEIYLEKILYQNMR